MDMKYISSPHCLEAAWKQESRLCIWYPDWPTRSLEGTGTQIRNHPCPPVDSFSSSSAGVGSQFKFTVGERSLMTMLPMMIGPLR